jgi:hypothetical protein
MSGGEARASARTQVNGLLRYSCAVFLALLGSCGAPEQVNGAPDQVNTSGAAQDAVYVSRDGTFALAAMHGDLYMGRLASDDEYTDIPRFMGSQGPFVDRSNSQMKCVSVNHITFAVPRSPRLGQHFQCNGLQFSVERCESAGRCDTYEIVARCRRFQGGRCFPDGNANEPFYSFRGSIRAGISEINFAPESDEYGLSIREGEGLLRRGSTSWFQGD